MSAFPIIRNLGGRDAVLEKLRACDTAASAVRTIDAMRMWEAPGRRGIPGWAILALMRIAETEGIAYRAADFDFDPPAVREEAA
ncbi:hypothetical protein [Oceanibacterium hippocampi]|uniref:Uncharacterized protein n=1 Tax=Oceanibacterium hippocampi TaxID=745714 RepID=A0A1Y5TZF9_9PROT|nr:hypothetical protein [Oceanibacterium hippocampi]SLN77533.1 hypothetical protein OCH7691_04447 [Oceanibacterium hippocampi]